MDEVGVAILVGGEAQKEAVSVTLREIFRLTLVPHSNRRMRLILPGARRRLRLLDLLRVVPSLNLNKTTWRRSFSSGSACVEGADAKRVSKIPAAGKSMFIARRLGIDVKHDWNSYLR